MSSRSLDRGQLDSLVLMHMKSMSNTRRVFLLNAETVFTNVFSGREARGYRTRLVEALGPISAAAPSSTK